MLAPWSEQLGCPLEGLHSLKVPRLGSETGLPPTGEMAEAWPCSHVVLWWHAVTMSVEAAQELRLGSF